MLLNCVVGEDSWESLGLQGHQTSQSSRKSVLNIHWKDWCWSWSSALTTWCKELTHWKRFWYWEMLKADGEGDNRGWDAGMASPTQWTWVWASSRSWWWTRKPGELQSMGSQRVRYNWAKELNWTDAELLGYFCTLAFPCEFGTWCSRWNTLNKGAEHRFIQNFHNTGENGKQYPTAQKKKKNTLKSGSSLLVH